MILTRYYARKPLEIAHVRAVRDLLTSKYKWGAGSKTKRDTQITAMGAILRC